VYAYYSEWYTKLLMGFKRLTQERIILLHSSKKKMECRQEIKSAQKGNWKLNSGTVCRPPGDWDDTFGTNPRRLEVCSRLAFHDPAFLSYSIRSVHGGPENRRHVDDIFSLTRQVSLLSQATGSDINRQIL